MLLAYAVRAHASWAIPQFHISKVIHMSAHFVNLCAKSLERRHQEVAHLVFNLEAERAAFLNCMQSVCTVLCSNV